MNEIYNEDGEDNKKWFEGKHYLCSRIDGGEMRRKLEILLCCKYKTTTMTPHHTTPQQQQQHTLMMIEMVVTPITTCVSTGPHWELHVIRISRFSRILHLDSLEHTRNKHCQPPSKAMSTFVLQPKRLETGSSTSRVHVNDEDSSSDDNTNRSHRSDSDESGVDDQIDSSWKQRLANSNLSGPTRSTSGRLPLKVADGSIIRNKAFDGDGAESLAQSRDRKDNKDSRNDTGNSPGGDLPESTKARKRSESGKRDTGDTDIDENLPRPIRIEKYKMRIAMLCEGIIRDPSGALKHSKTEAAKFDKMHRGTMNRDPTVQRLGIVSLYAVFKDVLPPFRIRVVTEAEMQSQMKKETRARREFEKNMLAVYQRYLKVLDTCALPILEHERNQMSAGIRRRRIRLIHAALTCMGLLVVSRPKFNFRSNILSLLIARLADDDMETRAIILKQIDNILFDDHVSEIAVEIVRSVSKLVKNKKYLVPRCFELLTRDPFES